MKFVIPGTALADLPRCVPPTIAETKRKPRDPEAGPPKFVSSPGPRSAALSLFALTTRYPLPTHTVLQNDKRRLHLLRIENPTDPESVGESAQPTFAQSVRQGLLQKPKALPFAYFYDEVGSALFDQICRLPEYYLTRTEDAILGEFAVEMVAGWSEPPTLIELGSGSAEKTRRLIAAAIADYGRLHFIPIDVSGSALEASAKQLVRAFSALRVTGFVGDYHAALSEISSRVHGPKLIVFLGSSLGNYEPDAAVALLAKLAGVMGPDDRLLLGTDLVKDARVLERAYDDAQGVTARFNRNLLARINRELHADFAIDRFRHRAFYRPDLARVEMHLESTIRQSVSIPGAGVEIPFEAGESIHTENSHKYTEERLFSLAERSGFVEEASWTDPASWFRVQSWRVA